MRALLVFCITLCLPLAGNGAGSSATGILSAETRFYYENLDEAVRFYREHLGLIPVERRADAVVLEVAPGARLTLATLESGGFTPDTPRTAAIALVTDQLDEWWEALARRGLNMRTEAYDPVPGRAHHGFVLVDPGGWFLEFERFNPHPENVTLMPLLDALPTRLVDSEAAGLPSGLGFKATVLWFYYNDLAEAESFVENGLALPLVTDQGWAKIHPVTPSAYLGLVDGARGMHSFTAEKAVDFHLQVEDVDTQAESLRTRGLTVQKIDVGTIEVNDPGGYRIVLAEQAQSFCLTAEACRLDAAAFSGVSRGSSTSARAGSQTRFYWMNRVNMASFVMLSEQGVIPESLTAQIADGIRYAMQQAEAPDGRRPSDVMQLEKIIMERAGAEATLVHSGRSRQDMYATIRSMRLRRQLLDVAGELNELRGLVLALASEHTETFVPAYTNGVQAQPTTYGHYLSAFANSFARDAERLREAYVRVNRSAMGTAVLANSSWPIDRERLAELLGFPRVVQNSYDANQVSPMDVQFEVAADLANLALRVGSMLEDIHVQYHQIEPWLLLDSASTYRSSSMPQKRNPGILMNARHSASDVASDLQLVLLRIHNVTPGMTDYKAAYAVSDVLVDAVEMLERFRRVLGALRIDGERSLAELEAEWTTSMNTAEAMQRIHGTPFRVGHSFASEIVTVARAEGYTPLTFPYEKAAAIYRHAAEKYALAENELPLTEAEFRASVSPKDMVLTRQGTGSPEPSEVRRLLAAAEERLAGDRSWLAEREDQLFAAEAALNAAFLAYLPRN